MSLIKFHQDNTRTFRQSRRRERQLAPAQNV